MIEREVQIRGRTFKIHIERDEGFFNDHWEQLEQGKEEPQTFKFIEKHLTSDTTLLDVGSWIGAMSLFGAGSAKNVFSFEADPIAFNSLTKNLACNPGINNVVPVNYFVGKARGSVTLYSEHYGNNSASSSYWTSGISSWEVRSINLDQFLEDKGVFGRVLLIMDIEGAEYDVVPKLELFKVYPDIALCLSLHPHLIARTVKGNDITSKLFRRIKLVWSTARVLKISRYFNQIYDSNFKPTTKAALLKELLLHGTLSPNFKELFFEK